MTPKDYPPIITDRFLRKHFPYFCNSGIRCFYYEFPNGFNLYSPDDFVQCRNNSLLLRYFIDVMIFGLNSNIGYRTLVRSLADTYLLSLTCEQMFDKFGRTICQIHPRYTGTCRCPRTKCPNCFALYKAHHR